MIVLIVISILLDVWSSYLKPVNLNASELVRIISDMLDAVWITWAIVYFLAGCGVFSRRKSKDKIE